MFCTAKAASKYAAASEQRVLDCCNGCNLLQCAGRVEPISWQPRAFVYHHFLSDEECDHIVSLAKPQVRIPVLTARPGPFESVALNVPSMIFSGVKFLF